MKSPVAPLLGSDVGNSFSEVPAVAEKVLSVVLAFAIGLVFRFSQDNGSALSRALAMTPRIFDPNLNEVRIVGRYGAFGNREAAFTGFHLDAVISDAEPDREAERL